MACCAPMFPNTLPPFHDLMAGVAVTGTVAGNVHPVPMAVLKLFEYKPV